MKIENPVLKGFNPDPSLVKAKDGYYIATSTFEWFPGVSIYFSKDMANWELITHALKDDTKIDLKGLDTSCGIWAPNLTYNNGLFYLMYTIVYTDHDRFKDTHNFLITTDDIRGNWSDPIFVNSSGFDPSLFHDDDGKKYIVNMVFDYRIDKNRFAGIDVQEFDYEKMQLIGEPKRIFRGTGRGVTEGPNIMKRGDWYYLICAEGGTGYNHCAIALRSKSIYGPYEESPYNPIISSKPESALQRAGHIQLTEDENGNWYCAYLCSRPIDSYSILGRETAIQNIKWTEDEWFKLSNNNDASPELVFDVLDAELIEPRRKIKYDFKDNKIPLDFHTLRQSFSTNGIEVRNEKLYIKGGCSISSKFNQGLIAIRQSSFDCNFKASVKFNPKHYRHMCSLVIYYNYDNSYQLRLSKNEKGRNISVCSIINKDFLEEEMIYIDEKYADNIFYLKAEIRTREVRFLYSTDGENYIALNQVKDMRKISDEHVAGNGFMGSVLGLNCVDLQGDGCILEVDSVEYEIL